MCHDNMQRTTELVLNLTIDTIDKVIVDHQFNSQGRINGMVSARQSQFEWCTSGIGPRHLEYVNVFHSAVQCYNAHEVDTSLSHQLDLRGSNIEIEIIRSDPFDDLALSIPPSVYPIFYPKENDSHFTNG